jgi:hypothetical protein
MPRRSPLVTVDPATFDRRCQGLVAEIRRKVSIARRDRNSTVMIDLGSLLVDTLGLMQEFGERHLYPLLEELNCSYELTGRVTKSTGPWIKITLR